MRRILHIFLLLAATGLSALAQDTLSVNGRTAAGRDPLRLSAREWSPAAFLLESIPQRSWAEAGVDLRREDQAWLTQEGDAALQGFFRTENLHRFERSAVLMGASYERGVKRNVRWNETSDFTLLYPYVMADSVGGDLQREQYAFQGHYAGRSGDWTWGAGMAYRALHEYRQVDPRPRNVTSDFRVDGTAGRILGPYALALTLSCRRYHQLQNTAFVNPKGANTTLFHMTGLGSHFACGSCLHFCAAFFRRLEPSTIRQSAGLSHLRRCPCGFESLNINSKNNNRRDRPVYYYLVRHEGLEPPTFAFVVRDSIQLS